MSRTEPSRSVRYQAVVPPELVRAKSSSTAWAGDVPGEQASPSR